MGRTDRIIRPAVALGMIALYAAGKVRGPGGVALLALSGLFLATSATGYCPLYQATGLSTRASTPGNPADPPRAARSMG